MLFEILPDPRALAPTDDGLVQTLQIHRALPSKVAVGRFVDDSGVPREVVDELIARDEYLDRLNRACVMLGDRLEVRFYDHFEEEFDAALLDGVPDVVNLAIDGVRLRNADTVERLARLCNFRFRPHFALRDRRMLEAFGLHRLRSFTLAGTSPMPTLDLAPIGEARELTTLRLLARGKNTEAIAACTSLTELALEPTTRFSLGCVSALERLEVLKLVLGVSASLAEIGPLPRLRDLSVFEVHLLQELGPLERFPALRRLQVSDQRRLPTIRVGPANRSLEHLRLFSVPALRAIEGLTQLPALKSLWAWDSRLELPWADLPRTLTHFQLVSRTRKGRPAHDAEVRAHGLVPAPHPDAEFFYK
jgi:hypothetical protein